MNTNSLWNFYGIFSKHRNPNIIDDTIDDVVTIGDVERKRKLFEHNRQYRTINENLIALQKLNACCNRVVGSMKKNIDIEVEIANSLVEQSKLAFEKVEQRKLMLEEANSLLEYLNKKTEDALLEYQDHELLKSHLREIE